MREKASLLLMLGIRQAKQDISMARRAIDDARSRRAVLGDGVVWVEEGEGLGEDVFWF